MRRKILSAALAMSMAMGLWINGSAAIAAETGTDTEMATVTDAESLEETQESVSTDQTVDAQGFVWDGTMIVGYQGTGGMIKIPETCTIINASAFKGNTTLTGVQISKNVEWISEDAFKGCTNLSSVNITEGIKSIGSGAFGGCTSLKSFSLPASVTGIGYRMLEGCSALEKIVVASGSESYTDGNSNAIIEKKTNKLMAGCKNTTIPDSVTMIAYGAFKGCSGLTEITIPEGVTSIKSGAFYDCTALRKVNIPAKVTEIQVTAFYRCGSLTELNIPASTTIIEDGAFEGCKGLKKITVAKENPVYNSNGNCNAVVETETGKLLVGCESTKLVEGITSIGRGIFYGCTGLKEVEIPSTITKIDGSAFLGCTGLTRLKIANGVTTIGDKAFGGCTGLTEVEIPSSVTKIGLNPFDQCSGLKKIVVAADNPAYNSGTNCNAIIETETGKLVSGCVNTIIPDTVKTLETLAFRGCTGLKMIEIPESVQTIFMDSFNECDNLKEIWGYPGTRAETFAKGNKYTFIDMTALMSDVTNVKAAAAGRNQVKVTWDKVEGATGYIVYAKKNGNYAKLTVTAATSYTDTKALDNEYNFYFVYAYTKTPSGKIVVGKCQKYAYAKGTCKAVTNLKASSVKGGVKLTWTKSVGADGYIVYGKRPGGTYGYVGMTSKNTSTSYTDTKADKKNYNFYWVFPYHNKNGKRVIGPICGYVYGKAK